MQYKPIIDITNNEIIKLWKSIFRINEITFVKRNIERNEIEVGFITTWGSGTEEHPFQDIEDTVIMYSDDFDEPDFLVTLKDHFKYKQYMVAKGYSQYWKDNPYVND